MILDGKGIVLGRLASIAAKNLLKGEEVVILNCDQVIITGNKDSIKNDFLKKRSRVGSGQKGPKHLSSSERIVKRSIRGMLPNHREGRGKIALKKLKCYTGIPKEFENKEILKINIEKKRKFSEVKEFKRK